MIDHDHPDFARAKTGLERLIGLEAAQRVFGSHVVVVGLGGVGSWAAESLVRTGVQSVTLIDMDHVAASNLNRQSQALIATLGMSKIDALAERLRGINPQVQIHGIDAFVTPENWLDLLKQNPSPPITAVLDACDAIWAKLCLAQWATQNNVFFVTVGAAGGKCYPEQVQLADLAHVTHDPLLARLRYQWRKEQRKTTISPLKHRSKLPIALGVMCVYSLETVQPPHAHCGLSSSDGSLNCHGYGSMMGVTATFGLCAASYLIRKIAKLK